MFVLFSKCTPTTGYPWPSDTASPVRVAQAGLAHPSCHVHPCLARWAHRLAPNCIMHPHWMYKRPWHLARPPVVAALAIIYECLWRIHRQTSCLQCVNNDPSVAKRRFCSLQTQHNVPAPSLLELQRERRETIELGYLGQCRRQPLETHEPCFGPPVAKNLVYGPRLVSHPYFGQVWGWSPTLGKVGSWSPPRLSNV
jgi:hypothetical protein